MKNVYIQNEAKKLQDTQNVTYNQCLQIIAQQNGYKSYQAILNQIKKDYIDDENEEIKEFKLNIFENRKHIKSNFIKIKKLAEKYKEIEVSEELDDDEEKRVFTKETRIKEILQKIIEDDGLTKEELKDYYKNELGYNFNSKSVQMMFKRDLEDLVDKKIIWFNEKKRSNLFTINKNLFRS